MMLHLVALLCILPILVDAGGLPFNLSCYDGTSPNFGNTTGCEVCLLAQTYGPLDAAVVAQCTSAAFCEYAKQFAYGQSPSGSFPLAELKTLICCDTDFCNDPALLNPPYSLSDCALRTSCYSCLYEAYSICAWDGSTSQCLPTGAAKKRDVETSEGEFVAMSAQSSLLFQLAKRHVMARERREVAENEDETQLPTTDPLYLINQQAQGIPLQANQTGPATFTANVSLHVGYWSAVVMSKLSQIDQAVVFDSKVNLEVFFLVGAVASMAPALNTLNDATFLDTLRANFVLHPFDLTDEIQAVRPGGTVKFGLGSFIDIPQAPFGSDPSEYLFRVESPLSSNDSDFSDALSALRGRLSNRNWYPEAGLTAAFLAAKRDAAIADGSFVPGVQPTPIAIGWNSDITTHVRLIVLVTDSVSASDATAAGITQANNLDANMDGNPAGSGENYNVLPGINAALVGNDIRLVVATIDCGSVNACVTPGVGKGSGIGVQANSYYLLLSSSSVILDVVDVSSLMIGDLNGSVDSLSEGINSSLNSLQIFPISDPLARVSALSQPYVKRDYSGSLGVLFYQPQNGQNYGVASTVVVRFSGLGDSVFYTYFAPDCQAPGTCYSNVSSTCVGCNDIFMVNDAIRPELDVCGVCGGENDSCVGCDNVTYSANVPVYDECNICGGKDVSCSGCDGVANSGAESNACGQCNVSDSACNGDGWSAVGIAGVTIFIASFLFLLLIGLVLLFAYLKLSALEAKLQKNPLCKEAKQRCA